MSYAAVYKVQIYIKVTNTLTHQSLQPNNIHIVL